MILKLLSFKQKIVLIFFFQLLFIVQFIIYYIHASNPTIFFLPFFDRSLEIDSFPLISIERTLLPTIVSILDRKITIHNTTSVTKTLKTILFHSCIIQSRFSSTSYPKKKSRCRFYFDPLCCFRETAHIRWTPRGTGAKCISRDAELFIATTLTSARGGTCNRRRRRRRGGGGIERARIERAKRRSRRRRSRIENPRATAQRLPRARNNNRATFAGTTPVAASFRMPCMIGRDEPCPQMLSLLSSASGATLEIIPIFPPYENGISQIGTTIQCRELLYSRKCFEFLSDRFPRFEVRFEVKNS